jgi:hypothetical protein
MSQFWKNLPIPQEVSSREITDTLLTVSPGISGSPGPVTPIPLSELSVRVEPRFSVPIRRSDKDQSLLQNIVSGEERFNPGETYPCTEPTTAIPPNTQNVMDQITAPIEKIQPVTTIYPYNEASPAMTVIMNAVFQHMRDYKGIPEQLQVPIPFKQHVSKDLLDLLGKDFDGNAIPSPFQDSPNIRIFFVEMTSNYIICIGRYHTAENLKQGNTAVSLQK